LTQNETVAPIYNISFINFLNLLLNDFYVLTIHFLMKKIWMLRLIKKIKIFFVWKQRSFLKSKSWILKVFFLILRNKTILTNLNIERILNVVYSHSLLSLSLSFFVHIWGFIFLSFSLSLFLSFSRRKIGQYRWRWKLRQNIRFIVMIGTHVSPLRLNDFFKFINSMLLYEKMGQLLKNDNIKLLGRKKIRNHFKNTKNMAVFTTLNLWMGPIS
jgi:hypothetical protein